MPKIKSSRGAAKRFKVTASGKFLRRRAGKSHLLQHKNRNRKRRLKSPALVHGTNRSALRRLLPYG